MIPTAHEQAQIDRLFTLLTPAQLCMLVDAIEEALPYGSVTLTVEGDVLYIATTKSVKAGRMPQKTGHNLVYSE
jgi:hypothetical protein